MQVGHQGGRDLGVLEHLSGEYICWRLVRGLVQFSFFHDKVEGENILISLQFSYSESSGLHVSCIG